MAKKYEMSAKAYKQYIVKKAIKDVAKSCCANFEIPMSAISKINYDNRMRAKPVRVSYDYVCNLMHEMIRHNEI